MYEEQGVMIDRTIASLLCSAIISDTLMFRSPTCTDVDKRAAESLSELQISILRVLQERCLMQEVILKYKTAEEICFQDFKKFNIGDVEFGVGQINSMNKEELHDIKEKLVPI